MLHAETILNPQQLLDALHEIEAHAGRKREVHWGPRTLDMDILFYDHIMLNTPQLTIPHADLHRRQFVLEPLCEIAPWYQHPVLHQTVQQLHDKLVNEDA